MNPNTSLTQIPRSPCWVKIGSAISLVYFKRRKTVHMFLLSASPQEFVDLVATVHRPSPLDLELTSSSGLSWIVSARHQPEDYETETSGVGVKRKDTRSPYSYVLQGSCVLRCCCGQVRFPVVCRFRCLQCFFPNRGCGRMHSNHQCNPAHSTLHAQKRSWTAVCQGYNSPRYGPRTTIHEKQCRKKHLAVCVLLCWQSVLRTQRMDICVLKCRSSVLHPAVVRVKDYLDSEPQWYEEKAKSYDRDPLATLLSSPQTENRQVKNDVGIAAPNNMRIRACVPEKSRRPQRRWGRRR